VSDTADDRIAELERVLAALEHQARRASQGSALRRKIEEWAEAALASALPLLTRETAPLAADVSEVEFERAFAAAEPELAEMITPDSIAEHAARYADPAPDEHPLTSSGAFATRTMAELLERQGDRRGAARIRAALGEAAESAGPSREDAAAIAALERWLENVRRLQA
jgi:hypothetical protein